MSSKYLIVIMTLLMGFGGTGCTSFGKSMKKFLGGDVSGKRRVRKGQKRVGKVDRKRKYKRTNHKTLQERSNLGAQSGSLWIERGQGSYLFTQNTNRLIGDLVNVEIEGQAKKQIETKVGVIQDLIDRIKKKEEERKLAAQKRAAARSTASAKGKKGAAPPPPPAPAAQKKQKFEVKVVPSRITDIMKDGSYMVQGEQPFMIGKREYKLIVKGIVRQADFNDQGISAETLLDPKFDVVTNRRKR